MKSTNQKSNVMKLQTISINKEIEYDNEYTTEYEMDVTWGSLLIVAECTHHEVVGRLHFHGYDIQPELEVYHSFAVDNYEVFDQDGDHVLNRS